MLCLFTFPKSLQTSKKKQFSVKQLENIILGLEINFHSIEILFLFNYYFVRENQMHWGIKISNKEC